MGELGESAIRLLQYLLPGFFMAWIFYGLTSHPKPSQFERTVQALIFTLLIQAVVFVEHHFFGDVWPNFFTSIDGGKNYLLASTFSAFLLGLIFSFSANSDCFHALARKLRITRETSYPSEWFGGFLRNVAYVVLQLKDGRRIYGWPRYWPSDPNEGHFILEQPSWLDETTEIPITGVSCIMVDVRDVQWVEFMEKK